MDLSLVSLQSGWAQLCGFRNRCHVIQPLMVLFRSHSYKSFMRVSIFMGTSVVNMNLLLFIYHGHEERDSIGLRLGLKRTMKNNNSRIIFIILLPRNLLYSFDVLKEEANEIRVLPYLSPPRKCISKRMSGKRKRTNSTWPRRIIQWRVKTSLSFQISYSFDVFLGIFIVTSSYWRCCWVVAM